MNVMSSFDHLRTGVPRFEAEIIFTNQYEVIPAIKELNKAGFDVEVMDWVDEGGMTYVWAIAMRGPGNADEDAKWWSKVNSIVKHYTGDCDTAGTSDIPSKAACAESNARFVVTPEYAELKREAAIVRKYAGLEQQIYPAADVHVAP